MTQGSKYADEQRKEAAVLYAVKGTYSQVARQTGIPKQTLRDWGQKDWWLDQIAQVRSENDELFKARYSQLIDEGTRIALEKLPEASAKEAAVIAAVAQDKLRLLMNQPTKISATSDSLSELAQRFAELSRSFRARDIGVVSVQDSESETTLSYKSNSTHAGS